jgi:hypothetical protein
VDFVQHDDVKTLRGTSAPPRPAMRTYAAVQNRHQQRRFTVLHIRFGRAERCEQVTYL